MHSFDLRSTFIRDFLHINASYWTAQSKGAHPGRGVIAVDLTHDHPVILQGNLVTAKYLQSMLGCPIVGVIADWRRVFFNFSKDANLALASSYGVTEILDLEDGVFETISAPPSICQFNRANVSELMSWQDGDFAMGEHILETYLRHFRRPALERIDADFQAIVDMTWRHKAALHAFDGEIRAFVTAHIDYSTFRLVAMRAFQDGGFVVYPSPAGCSIRTNEAAEGDCCAPLLNGLPFALRPKAEPIYLALPRAGYRIFENLRIDAARVHQSVAPRAPGTLAR